MSPRVRWDRHHGGWDSRREYVDPFSHEEPTELPRLLYAIGECSFHVKRLLRVEYIRRVHAAVKIQVCVRSVASEPGSLNDRQ